MFDSVIFDFDGTVADTGVGVFESIRYAIDKEGLPQPPDSEMRKFVGPPFKQSFPEIFPWIDEACVDRLIEWYREVYSVDGIYKFTLYDGMEELLRFLKENGIKTGIASSKPEIFINQILDKCDLRKYFDVPVGASGENVHPDKAEIVNAAKVRLAEMGCTKPLMVGDRKFDIAGAKAENVPCAAVLYGYGSREEFEKYGADYIVADCDELKQIIMG